MRAQTLYLSRGAIHHQRVKNGWLYDVVHKIFFAGSMAGVEETFRSHRKFVLSRLLPNFSKNTMKFSGFILNSLPRKSTNLHKRLQNTFSEDRIKLLTFSEDRAKFPGVEISISNSFVLIPFHSYGGSLSVMVKLVSSLYSGEGAASVWLLLFTRIMGCA
jgi:hypothetical protein